MKTAFLIVTLLVSSQLFSQKEISKNVLTITDNISFFDNSYFILEYFFVNDKREDLLLEHPSGQYYDAPFIEFNFNTTNNELIMTGGLYCNGITAGYYDRDTYLEFIFGGSTLTQCDILSSQSQESRFLFILQPGNFTSENKVYYEITSDQKGLWLWVEANEKLFFTKATLSFDEYNHDKLIQVFPNPANNYLDIESTEVEIFKVSIYDIQGKEILVKLTNYNKIDVSDLERGIYFVKLKTDLSTLTKKIILR